MFTPLVKRFQFLSATKQFFVARTFYDWALFVFDTFYMAYVFKESGDVRQVVYNILITLLTIFVGFVFGSWWLTKVGVERNLRHSFLLYILTGIVGIVLASQGMVSYLLISSVRGIAEGFFWASANLIELSGLPHDSRTKFYSVSYGLNQLFFIVAPITLGVMLESSGSLLPSFVIFSIICAIAAILPFRFEGVKNISISKKNFIQLLKKPRIFAYSVVKMILAGYWMLDWLLFSLIPFIVLGSEVNMGVYLTVSSLLGIILALFTSKFTLERKKKWAFPLLVVALIADLLLVVQFTPVMLYVNSVLLTIAAAVVTPVEYDLAVNMTNKIDAKSEMSVELNVYQEFVYTLARMLLGGMVLLVIATNIPLLTVLKVLVVAIAVIKVTFYFAANIFLKRFN